MEFIAFYECVLQAGKHQGAPAVIYGYNANKSCIVKCSFWEHEKLNMPGNGVENKIVNLNYDVSEYDRVLDLFRNERPLRLEFDARTGQGCIRTELEPVGEGEMLAH